MLSFGVCIFVRLGPETTMFLLPYDRFRFETTLPTSEVVDRLRSEAQSSFSGGITETGFTFVRNCFGRNSYLPRVQGRFMSLPTGTHVIVTTSIQPLVVATLLAALLILAYISVRNGHGALTPVVFLVVCHACLYFIGYLPERRRAVALMQQVFGADVRLGDGPHIQSTPN